MSYTPTVWKTGDIVSSQRLNKLEEGVKGAYEVMVINTTDGTLDKTWQEIYDAMAQGKVCVVRSDNGTTEGRINTFVVISVYVAEGTYMLTADMYTYRASSATGTLSLGGGEDIG